MKKILIIIMIILIPKNTQAISASSYVVMDMASKDVLVGSNIHESRLIASISKIMTAIIAIEKGNLQDEVLVNKNVLKSTGSAIYLEIGEKITLEDLLYGLMLRSGNDAAMMIAIHISGTMEDFAVLMNEYAKKIGMENTFFLNSSGLEEANGKGNTSSAYDMALLTTYAYQNVTFKKIFGTKNYTTQSSKKSYSWQNKNRLLKYDYITGGKTGFTKKARRTLVTTGLINNMDIVIVTLNDPNDWDDHLYLYKLVKKNYTKLIILDKEKFKVLDDIIYIEDTLYINNSYSLTVKNEDTNRLKIKYYLYDNNYYNGKKVGNANIYLEDKLIHSEPIYIKVEEKTFVNKIKIWFKKLFF